MRQKKIYRTVEAIASQKFSSEEELLNEVIKQIIETDQINVSGARVWVLDVDKKSYRIMSQKGEVEPIKENFTLAISEYPVFDRLTQERTILADETNSYLLRKGIAKFSASGIGSKRFIDEKRYYEYMIAVNSDHIDSELRYTLNIIATVLTAKIHEYRSSLKRKTLIADLDKAKELQRSILPEHELNFHAYSLFGVTLPAEILGGDFFDYLKIGRDEERLGITVGDAASKGLAAAAEAMYISGAVRMASTFQMKISPMLYRLNELVNKIFSDDRFTTMFYGEISNDKKGLFLYANAGHNPPMFYSKRNNKITYLEPTGPLLGPAPKSRFETDSLNFERGDLLVIYSDGIVEAANDKFEFYEEHRLEKLIKEHSDYSPRDLVYTILEDVQKFSTNNSQYQDDKTVVVIKRNEADEAG